MNRKYRAPEPLADDAAIARARYVPQSDEYGEWITAKRRSLSAGYRQPQSRKCNAEEVGNVRTARAARHADVAPPEVTRGERAIELVAKDGKIIEIPARRGYGGDAAFIDWLNFTVDETSFYWCDQSSPVTDDQLIMAISLKCEAIFGYGITAKRDKGANFYQKSWELGDGFGLVCYGGQRDTVLISVSGTGLAAAQEGWEKRLYTFLETGCVRPRITRIDLAHDDYTGETYSVDKGMEDYRSGLMNAGGRTPDVETRGNWEKPNGKGRTLYVGNRKNGKFLRVYEKGRQLGSPTSEWVRIEGELKAVDREIPHDVLIDAGAYLAAMYPAIAFIAARQKRIVTKKKEAVFSYDKLVDWLHRQCGAALWFAKEIEGGADALMAKIMKVGEFPKSIKHISDYRTCGVPVHKMYALGLGSNPLIA